LKEREGIQENIPQLEKVHPKRDYGAYYDCPFLRVKFCSSKNMLTYCSLLW